MADVGLFSVLYSLQRRTGMGLQAFSAGDQGRFGRDLSRGSGIKRDQADDVDKIPNVERGGEAGAAAGWHDMAGTSHIIAQHLKGLLAHKDAACVGDLLAQCPGIINRQAEMLGCVSVAERGGFIQVLGDHNAALPRQGLRQDVGARQGFHLVADFDLNGLGQLLGWGE